MSDENFKIVSEINPSFMTKLIPRAKPMINDTPTKLEAPLIKASTVHFSPNPCLPIPAMNMITIVTDKNIAAITGNHQP